MLPSACGLRQHFQDLGHSFSVYGPPSRQITNIYFLFPVCYRTAERPKGFFQVLFISCALGELGLIRSSGLVLSSILQCSLVPWVVSFYYCFVLFFSLSLFLAILFSVLVFLCSRMFPQGMAAYCFYIFRYSRFVFLVPLFVLQH